MRTKLSTCPPPVWGEVAERVGRRRREWDKPLGPTVEGRTGERPPPRKHSNLPQHARPTRKEKKKIISEDGFQEKKNKKNINWFLQYFFFYSCVFFPPPSLFETLKLESSVAAALLFFQSCRLVHPVEYCMKDTKEKKNINDNSNNENLLYVGGTLFSHICCGLFWVSLFFANAFLFLFLSPLSGICFCFIYPWRFSRSLVDDIYLLRTKRFFLLACLYILSRMPATDTARFAHICMWNKPFVTKVILKGYKWNQGQSGEETWRPYWELTLANQ